MAIRAALEGTVFSPEDVAVLVAAFEAACLELGQNPLRRLTPGLSLTLILGPLGACINEENGRP